MLKPAVQIHNEAHALVAEFWDCFRLDQAPVKELRTQYEAHLRSNGPPILIVDLLGVGFAGSAALGLFATLQKMVRQAHGQIIFCNVDPTVFEVFRISRLNALFEFVPDRHAALERAALLARDANANADADGTPAPQPTVTPSRAPAPGSARNSGSESLLRRHRRRNL